MDTAADNCIRVRIASVEPEESVRILVLVLIVLAVRLVGLKIYPGKQEKHMLRLQKNVASMIDYLTCFCLGGIENEQQGEYTQFDEC